jgi:uncharacterized protein YggT (Ycf19 family)
MAALDLYPGAAIRHLFHLYYAILLVRVVLSYLRLPPWHWASRTIGAFCEALTEPLLKPLRRALDPHQRRSGLDFSPLVLYLILTVVEGALIAATRGGGR